MNNNQANSFSGFQWPEIESLCLREIDNAVEECHTKWARLIVRKSDQILLAVDPNNPERIRYPIDLNRIQTHDDLLDWVCHLSDKDWITTEYIQHFIEQVRAAKGWRHRV